MVDETDPVLIFGAALRQAREESGLTQTQVAKAIGSTQAVVSETERGLGNPSLRLCVALAGAFGAVPDLFTLFHALFTHEEDHDGGSISTGEKEQSDVQRR